MAEGSRALTQGADDGAAHGYAVFRSIPPCEPRSDRSSRIVCESERNMCAENGVGPEEYLSGVFEGGVVIAAGEGAGGQRAAGPEIVDQGDQ